VKEWSFGPLNLNLFILLPGLLNLEDTNATNFPTSEQLSWFMDQVFHPPLYEELPSDILQHMPATFAEALLNTA